jgi:dGTPase
VTIASHRHPALSESKAVNEPTLVTGSEHPRGPVADAFERRMREREEAQLSPLATRSYPAQRARPEPDCGLRTPFQRDRDRIVHCKAFRRLKHKTQVFVAPSGDHYRTRLTHTLEVTQVSRTVARALGLNEDLVEAIGLGHDLGHPPFGHVGEEALDRCLRERFGRAFLHHEHSLRVVDTLERDGQGLNLTAPVRDGIVSHSGRAQPPATLEGKIVRLVDRVAYINHDIDDAVRAGVLSATDLPAGAIEILGDTGQRRIDMLVHDLVEHSDAAGDIVQGERVGSAMSQLRTFMFDHVYLGPVATREHAKIHLVVSALFEHYCANPEELPASIPAGELATRVTDYVAGMTDRYCIKTFEQLSVPVAFAP